MTAFAGLALGLAFLVRRPERDRHVVVNRAEGSGSRLLAMTAFDELVLSPALLAPTPHCRHCKDPVRVFRFFRSSKELW